MSNTPKRLMSGLLGVQASSTFSVVPAAKQWIITNLLISNTDSTARNFSITFNDVAILSGYSLSPKQTLSLDCASVMNAGEFLVGWADVASKVSVYISGVEVDA